MMTFIRTRKNLISLVAAVAVILTVQMCAFGGKKTSLDSQLGSVQNKIKSVKSKIKQKDAEKKTVLGQLEATEKDLEAAQSKLAANKLLLLDAQSDLQRTVARLEQTQRRLDRRQELLIARIVDIYQGEDLTYANVVLDAADTWTFLTRSYYLQKILDSDAQLIRQIKEDKARIEKDKARQAARVAEIEALQEQLESQRNRIKSLADSKSNQLKAIEHSKELYEKALDELLAQSRRIEEQIRRIQNTPEGKARYAKAFKGGLIMPVQGRITSPFGYRVHPITKVYKLHTGVDIAASTGTPIKAAADGVVIISGWLTAYGNTVAIDHGGGVSTLYAHASKLLVKTGQQVKQGDIIAKVGSTGYSTGPHLHFEKRVNGKPVNPL